LSVGFQSFNDPAGSDGTPKARELDVSSEFDKEIFPKFALGFPVNRPMRTARSIRTRWIGGSRSSTACPTFSSTWRTRPAEALSDMIPLVEFSTTTPFDRSGGTTTGTINPGILWEQPDFKIGVEAVIPINAHTGPNVGAVVQVQISSTTFSRRFSDTLYFLTTTTRPINESFALC
jgi:hypothetical protein